MPKITDDMEDIVLPQGNYKFSAVKIANLTGTNEYTQVAIVFDESGSTNKFSKEMEECLKAVVTDLYKSPRCDNLLVTDVHFGSAPREVHGYKLLKDINVDDYDGSYQPGGQTTLYDTVTGVAKAMNQYAQTLRNQDYDVNGIIIVMTDGQDFGSKLTQKYVREAFEECVKGEALESLVTILIGVNLHTEDAEIKQFEAYLENFTKEAAFSQYISIKDVKKNTIAKLANFISRSTTSQSQHLGTGGPSKSLQF